ncbi:MAG: hypothetical protein IPQ07_14280 [Myxococcales bacterium]|nr:hypothetical protein [Myxococcales bacterium]
MRPALTLFAVLVLMGPAQAAPSTEDQWLAGLTDRVVADLTAGRPLVVEVHVPLCESTIIACGNKKLGDGDNPETNLYWATTPGFGEWFARRGSGWKRMLKQTAADTGDADVLAVHVYRRTLATPAAWKKRGAPAKLELDIVVHGWRGKAIDRALAAYAADVSGSTPRTIKLDDGTTLAAGGAAQIVAWVGHNRLMDLESFQWPTPATMTKGAIAIACHTAAYMEEDVPAATRVPLLMTRDFLFANAAPLEATVLAFASGGTYAKIRLDAATAYAGVQKREVRQVYGAFTNPADKRWKKR